MFCMHVFTLRALFRSLYARMFLIDQESRDKSAIKSPTFVSSVNKLLSSFEYGNDGLIGCYNVVIDGLSVCCISAFDVCVLCICVCASVCVYPLSLSLSFNKQAFSVCVSESVFLCLRVCVRVYPPPPSLSSFNEQAFSSLRPME